MKTSNLTLFLTLFLLGTLVVSAQQPRQRERQKQMMEHLNLSEDQKSKIQKLHKGHQDQMIALRSKLKIKEAELDAALLTENSSEAKILAKSINQLSGDLLVNRVDHQLAVKALLDEDQKRRFDQMILAKEKRGEVEKKMHRSHHGHQQQSKGNRPGRGGL